MELLRTTLQDGDPPMLYVEGEIDISTAEQLQAALDQALAGSRDLAVDMRGVTFCDAAGLGTVIQVASSRTDGDPLKLINAKRVKWILDVVGLADLPCIDIRDTCESTSG